MLQKPHEDWSQEVPDKFLPILRSLWEAIVYAEDTNSAHWDFAVSMSSLISQGLTESDLRWLVRRGWVIHARDVTPLGANGRVFRSTGDLTFVPETCFILSPMGIAQFRSGSKTGSTAVVVNSQDPIQRCDAAGRIALPHWDTETRCLLIEGKVEKRFKWPAVNQEMILCAFQEEDWPGRIDDPLPPQPEQDLKRRLSDTIKCLNRGLKRVRFHGDGTGQGITWQLDS